MGFSENGSGESRDLRGLPRRGRRIWRSNMACELSTIGAILTTERHKGAVSPAPEYRMQRVSNVSAISTEERTST